MEEMNNEENITEEKEDLQIREEYLEQIDFLTMLEELEFK